MKGPRNRTVLDVRRAWKCGRCGKERRMPADITSVQCSCQSPPVWMTIVAERSGRLPPGLVTLPDRIPLPEWRPEVSAGNDFPATRGADRPNKRPPRGKPPAPGQNPVAKPAERGDPPAERPASTEPRDTTSPNDNEDFAEGLGLSGDTANPSGE